MPHAGVDASRAGEGATATSASSASSSSAAPAAEQPVLGEAAGTKGLAQTRATVISPAWREGALAAAELLQRRSLAKAPEGTHLDVTLRQIRYSQESIRGSFRDGRKVAQMRKELHMGEKTLADIPRIAVSYYNNVVYTSDNRRLWTFKHSGIPSDMRVPVVARKPDGRLFRKLTTPTTGRTIRRRSDEGFM